MAVAGEQVDHRAGEELDRRAGDRLPLRARLARLSASGATEVLAPGLYAWAVTVAAPAVARSSPTAARATAFAALVALVAGPIVAVDRPRLGRIVGIWTLLAAAVATWLLASAALAPGRLDPWQGALGALGWGVFALGWGAAERRVEAPDEGAAVSSVAPPLAPRATLGRGAMAIVALAISASILPLALAWRVSDVHRALFAHAIALAAGVALVASSGIVAIGRGRHVRGAPRDRLSSAASALMLAAGLALFGAAYALLR